MTTKLLIIQRSAPYGTSLAREGLDYILTSAAYDQDISLLFLGDGVFQLLKDQEAQKIQLKSQISAMEILPLYDIEKLYAIKEDLDERNLSIQMLGIEITIISRSQVSELTQQQDKVLAF